MLTQDWLVSKGYLPNGGLISPNGEYFYLNIPKNASTYLTNILLANGWQHHILTDKDSYKITFSFVRDPINRWISGFATYAALHLCGSNYGSDHFVQDYNDLVERLIFDQVFFDDHTAPQIIYLDQIKLLNPVYLKYNTNLVDQINLLCNLQIDGNLSVDSNLTENNYDTQQISQFITEKIKNNPQLTAKLVSAYKQDYNFINSHQFYEQPRM